MFTGLLKNLVKDTDEKADEEMHGARGFCPGGSGVCHLPRKCSPTWKFSEPRPIRILMEASSHRQDRSLTPFSALLPTQENGGQG